MYLIMYRLQLCIIIRCDSVIYHHECRIVENPIYGQTRDSRVDDIERRFPRIRSVHIYEAVYTYIFMCLRLGAYTPRDS